jgi:hypothetical protein
MAGRQARSPERSDTPLGTYSQVWDYGGRRRPGRLRPSLLHRSEALVIFATMVSDTDITGDDQPRGYVLLRRREMLVGSERTYVEAACIQPRDFPLPIVYKNGAFCVQLWCVSSTHHSREHYVQRGVTFGWYANAFLAACRA